MTIQDHKMPGRLRNSAGQPSESSAKKRYNIPGIKFDEPLSWRAGKAIAVADLLSRLQKLQSELTTYDEDNVDHAAFTRLGLDLASTNLLGHKDRGVRAWAVACVVDLLRICAPDAPFSNSQLKDIFTVIISSILPALADPSNAYNAQHFYVLKSLTEYKSIILIADVDHAENLILPLVTACFDIVSGSSKHSGEIEVSKTVEFHLNNLLAVVIDEVDVPQEVTDIIISQFLRIEPNGHQPHTGKKKQSNPQDAKQGNLLLKEYPAAYNMAKFVCTTCTERMLSLISAYFANVIVDASSTTQVDRHPKHAGRGAQDLNPTEDDVEGLADLSKAHRLVRELWRACPDVLVNVVPQIETELSSATVALRVLATETLGDLAAGVGLAGLPPSSPLDPSIYPLPSVNSQAPSQVHNALLAPKSPKPFAAVHSSAYANFLSRKQDKSPLVRAAWVAAVGRILITSAGGVSINETDQQHLLTSLAQMLGDSDESVRLATIRSISAFDYQKIIDCLGTNGGVSQEGSLLNLLAERCKDKKQPIREAATNLLAEIWGVASADIEAGNERVMSLLSEAPTRIFGIYYLNEPEIHVLLDKVLHEYLLPISFPPIKVQISRTESQRQRAKDKEGSSQEGPTIDPDAIRVRRMLTLVRGLNAKTRPVFFAIQNQQVQLSKAVDVLLKTCEQYNGGVMEENEEKVKADLSKYIDFFAKLFPDPPKFAADLWKFAKVHDRRNYQLIRFATGPQNDYRTVTKAIKELTKRISTGPTSTQSLLDTLTPLLYRVSLLIYNRSHVPAIMEIAHSDESGLAEVANEALREISSRNPEVLKTHILDLCRDLEDNAPSSSRHEESSAADSLKACAAFARRYPSEIPKERRFLTSLTQYALFSTSPRAAKHAVSVVLVVAEKKEMYAKEILQKALKDCKFASPYFLSRLAAIAQICLLAPTAANAESERIVKLAVADILPKNLTRPSVDVSSPDGIENETRAKELALKMMVNRCRSEDEKADPVEFGKIASPLFTVLMRLINDDGEITPTKDTPITQKHRLKLTAARFILKLCRHQRKCEELVTPTMFISMASIVLNPPNSVRVGFVNQLKKYLGQNKLNYRWFTILFLLAFEPDEELKTNTVTWLKSRVQFYTRLQQQSKIQERRGPQNVMESVFARLLSLLAHHPDYPERGTETFDVDLLDFSKYICFYLSAVATEENLSLIFHISQRVKQARDAVTDTNDMSERLYVLSDLAQATIRNWADNVSPQTPHARGTNLLQTWPGKVSLPTTLFKPLPNHEIAQEIAENNFLPEDVSDGLEKLVRAYIKASRGGHYASRKGGSLERKRRPEGDADSRDNAEGNPPKKSKKVTSLPVRRGSGSSTKTPKLKRKTSEAPSSDMPSRKSSRITKTTSVNYTERDTSEDEAEMEENDRLSSSPVQMKGRAENVTVTSSPLVLHEVVGTETTMEDIQFNGQDDKENDEENDVLHEVTDGAEKDVATSPLKEKGNERSTPLKKSQSNKGKTIDKKKTAESESSLKSTPTRTSNRVTRSTKS